MAAAGRTPYGPVKRTPPPPPARDGRGGPGKGAGGKQAAEAQVKALNEKVELSQTIMRKLYKKNVELDKEVQVLKTEVEMLTKNKKYSDLPGGGGAEGVGGGNSTVLTVLKQRDKTIEDLNRKLQEAEDMIRILQSSAGGVSSRKSSELQSDLKKYQFHFKNYKQLRNDYKRLLDQRSGIVSRKINKDAKRMVGELKSRLDKEMEERELEAALLTTQLYEQDKRESDLYVEKRLLEQKVGALQQEIYDRDKIDTQIENCVCSLFEKVNSLESANKELVEKLNGREEGGGP